jgi:hypothetical protein
MTHLPAKWDSAEALTRLSAKQFAKPLADQQIPIHPLICRCQKQQTVEGPRGNAWCQLSLAGSFSVGAYSVREQVGVQPDPDKTGHIIIESNSQSTAHRTPACAMTLNIVDVSISNTQAAR